MHTLITKQMNRTLTKASHTHQIKNTSTPDYELMAIHAFRIAFLMTEAKQTGQARKFINENIPRAVYDVAFEINEESSRKDKAAILIRYVFQVISFNTYKNYLPDLKRMHTKIKQTDWDEFTRLYNLYRNKPKNRCPCEPLPLFPCP